MADFAGAARDPFLTGADCLMAFLNRRFSAGLGCLSPAFDAVPDFFRAVNRSANRKFSPNLCSMPDFLRAVLNRPTGFRGRVTDSPSTGRRGFRSG